MGLGGHVNISSGNSLIRNSSTVPRRVSGVLSTTEEVVGARHVWGTLSICSSGAVQSAIKKFCGIESIRFEKIMSNGYHQWWFVLHDDEIVLCRFSRHA